MNEGLCGRQHDRLQLICISLGSTDQHQGVAIIMRSSFRGGLMAWCLCSLALDVAHSQVRSRELPCVASNQGTSRLTWWNRRGSGTPDAAELASVFTGRFDVVEVQTEGAAERSVRRWQVALVPADSEAQRCGPAMCSSTGPSGRLYPFHGALLGADVVWDSVRAREGESFGRSDVWLRLEEQPLALTLQIGPPRTLDVGASYQIREVNGPSGATFAGRWGGGGLAMMVRKIGGVSVGEQHGGYFCATRIP